jgi:hypothetical protein
MRLVAEHGVIWNRHTTLKLRILFRGHQWHIEENYATQGTEQECVRCGTHRSTLSPPVDVPW